MNGVPGPSFLEHVLNGEYALKGADLLTHQPLRDLSHDQLIQLIVRQNQLINQLSVENRELKFQKSQTNHHSDHHSDHHFPTSQAQHLEMIKGAEPQLLCQLVDTSHAIPLIDGLSWTLGRGDENLIVLDDQCMSRNHAIIQKLEAKEFFLIDLGSRNGSFINSRRVNIPVALKHGDQITLGQTTLTFSCPHLESKAKATIPSGFIDDALVPATNVLHVRRLISVLVVDIRNFTGLTRQLDERILSEVVGAWFNAVGTIIRHHGSWVDKYIGDAVMAVWIHGSHDVGQEEILRPLRALRSLHEMTSQLHTLYPLPFPLRIGSGLNTGYAMVGNTGSGDRPDYTALGDTVNAAFRLETSTKQIGVDLALGLRTYQYLQQHFPENLPFQQQTLDLKGYEFPTPAYTCNFPELDGLLT